MTITIPSYVIPIIITVILGLLLWREEGSKYSKGPNVSMFIQQINYLIGMIGIVLTWASYFALIYLIKL